MNDKRNLVVSLSDQNYVDYAKQLFSSIYHNSGWKGDYMLLAHNISIEDIEWFRSKNIYVKECKPLYTHFVGKEKYPPVVFDVFYLFTAEFKKWKNIIFLDADIIVRASLDKLTTIKGFSSPHVIDDKLKYFFYDDINNKQFDKLQATYNLEKPAFNCAVMAFSTDIIGKNNIHELKQLYEKFQEISSGLDPTLNLYFYKKWKRLPIAYDVTPEKIENLTGKNKNSIDGIIIHLKDSELKDKNSKLYKEWKDNLLKADYINLKNILSAKKWSNFRIYYFSFKVYFLLYIKTLLNRTDRCSGNIGKRLKESNIKLYRALKRIIKT